MSIPCDMIVTEEKHECRLCGEREDIMNVQELFAKIDRDELSKKLGSFYPDDLVESVFDEFEDLHPYISEDRLLTDEQTITNTRLGFNGAVIFAEWSDVLGAEIGEKCFEKFTELELAAELFQLMTEFGFDDDEHTDEVTKQLDGGSLAI